MPKIRIFEKIWCPYCKMAKSFFKQKGVEIEAINVEQNSQEHDELKARYNMHTVPMIFINDKMIGGFTELIDLDDSGELEELFSTKEI